MDMQQQDFLSGMDVTIPSYFHHQQQEVVHERKPITAAAAAAAATAANHHHSSTTSLLGVRKPPAKSSKRSPIDPPVPPKVYRVEPRGFRQLVQRLTGSTTTTTTQSQPPPPTTTTTSVASSNSLRLRDAAPAPLHLDLNQQRTMSSFDGSSVAGGGKHYSVPFSKSPVVEGGQISPMGGLFSPSLFSAYMAWSSHPVLSPGTMASVDRGTFL